MAQPQETQDKPLEFQLSDTELAQLPAAALRVLIRTLLEQNARQEQRIMELEAEVSTLIAEISTLKARLGRNSSNSNKPPSSDSPYQENPPKSGRKKPAGRKGRKGYRQQLLPPTNTEAIHPGPCSCGCQNFINLQPYHTHQHIELPEIVLSVLHFILYRGRCAQCGKTSTGHTPQEFQTGFGPRLSALVAEISGIEGNSRQATQSFCSSVLGCPISLGALQKIIDRASEAILPHYEAIGEQTHKATVNHVDETPWRKRGKLHWLWNMASPAVSFFMIHANRSEKAFHSLVGDWQGILVSDGYRLYRNWKQARQSCLAHLIRRAKGLAERKEPEPAQCGSWTKDELRRLCTMAKDPPTRGQWQALYARLHRLIAQYADSKNEAGRLVRHLDAEMQSLFTFLLEEGVEPTNNFGERMLRHAVLWRKRSQGTRSDKGNRWVERILSLRQTCRLQGKSTYHVLTEAMESLFKNQPPELGWIRAAA